jgi:hypothetical protein
MFNNVQKLHFGQYFITLNFGKPKITLNAIRAKRHFPTCSKKHSQNAQTWIIMAYGTYIVRYENEQKNSAEREKTMRPSYLNSGSPILRIPELRFELCINYVPHGPFEHICMYINKLLAHTFKNVYKIPRSINFNH